MAYTINLFDGTLLTTVADGTIDTAATNIKLVGKNFTGYGELMNENLIHMLENFADASEPTTPLTGQIWWNSAIGTSTVYDGTQFKAVSSSTVSATTPTGAVEGDLWWDSTNEQLFVYNGSTWVLVGPSASAGAGQSGAIVEIITDTLATDHVVVANYVSDTIISVTSGSATFTPEVAWTGAHPGFTTIEPGVNLIAEGTLAGVRYQGTATNADLLDNLDSLQFLRSDVADATTAQLSITDDTGLLVGASGDLQLLVNGTVSEVMGRTDGENLRIGSTNVSSQERTAFIHDPDAGTIDFANGVANNQLVNVLDPTAPQHAATKAYIDGQVNESGGGPLFRDGTNTITGSISPSADNTYDLGTTGTARFRTIYAITFEGLATEANYADLAERFEADGAYEPGTVVMLGGVEEITEVNEELSDDIFGVISTAPGFLMNAKAGTDDTHPPVAMSGRVPVRVIGEVSKGDRLVSAGNGLARAATKAEINSFNVIGRSLEDKVSEGEGTVEAIVHMNS